jgi:membrane-associated protease RseP (regulator of RpoE activity)
LHWYARMRLCSAVLFVALTGGAAFAGSKVPLRVVRVMPDTHQALLYDKTQGTHVLVEQGKSIDGYLVEDIDEDEVTLVGDSGTEIVLAAPDYRHRHDDDKPEKADKKPAGPQDPYASPSTPQDPYAEAPAGDVRTTEAPGTPAPTAVRTAEAPDAAPTTAPATVAAAPAAAAAPAPTPTTDVVWSSSTPPVAADAPIALTRADVNASLANFGKLAGSIHGAFTADGARLDAIAPDSLFAKAGLHNGDVITAVDGQPLKSLDAAASLYARAAGVKTLTLSVIRAAKPLTLRVVIAQ